MITAVASACLAILAGSWLCWQLLRQNGRLLLRLEELEKRLDSIELGEPAQPAGLPIGSPAPEFDLPDLTGCTRTRTEFRGKSVLLIFFNPECGFCRELVPRLAALPPHPTSLPLGSEEVGGSADKGLSHLLIISTGDVEANRQLFKEHQLNCPVLLQKELEVADAYQTSGTPSGYLINPEGKIASRLAIGAEALLEIAREPRSSRGNEAQTSAAHSSSSNGHSEDQSLVTSAATNRFTNRSLAKSKIKRDGLKAGTLAPDFRLPRLDGRGELGLADFRGRRVLVVFSSPPCGPCNALAPELEKFYRSQGSGCTIRDDRPLTPVLSPSDGKRVTDGPVEEEFPSIEVVMISKGEAKENRAKVKEHGLTFPIVLQQQWEISRRYAMFATPIAYLIDEQGVIVHEVAVGTDAIQNLMRDCSVLPQKLVVR
jgi:peroxiredoxin